MAITFANGGSVAHSCRLETVSVYLFVSSCAPLSLFSFIGLHVFKWQNTDIRLSFFHLEDTFSRKVHFSQAGSSAKTVNVLQKGRHVEFSCSLRSASFTVMYWIGFAVFIIIKHLNGWLINHWISNWVNQSINRSISQLVNKLDEWRAVHLLQIIEDNW